MPYALVYIYAFIFTQIMAHNLEYLKKRLIFLPD